MKAIVETLQICPFCGRQVAEMHKRCKDRCDECGKRYELYKSYKSKQRKSFKVSRAKQLAKIEAEYIDLRTAGYKVPHDFDLK